MQVIGRALSQLVSDLELYPQHQKKIKLNYHLTQQFHYQFYTQSHSQSHFLLFVCLFWFWLYYFLPFTHSFFLSTIEINLQPIHKNLHTILLCLCFAFQAFTIDHLETGSYQYYVTQADLTLNFSILCPGIAAIHWALYAKVLGSIFQNSQEAKVIQRTNNRWRYKPDVVYHSVEYHLAVRRNQY